MQGCKMVKRMFHTEHHNNYHIIVLVEWVVMCLLDEPEVGLSPKFEPRYTSLLWESSVNLGKQYQFARSAKSSQTI